MTSPLRFFLVCSVLLLTSAAAPRQPAQSSYYPLSIGTTWHYRCGQDRFILRVVKIDKVGDVPCALLEARRGDKVVGTQHLAVAAGGLYRHDLTYTVAQRAAKGGAKDSPQTVRETFAPPMLILKLPPKKGDAWKVNSTSNGKTYRGAFQVDEEQITVPAGSYKTFRVASQDLEVNGLKAAVTTFHAEGVGMVKQTIAIGDAKTEIVLEKFDAGDK